MCEPYQCFWDIFADRGEVSNNEGHQVGAHVDTCPFKLISHEAIGKNCGNSLKHNA